MQKKYAKELLNKYNSGTCTDEEKALLESWYLQWKGKEFDLSNEELELIKGYTWNEIIKSKRTKGRIFSWIPYLAAAIVFVIFSIGLLFYLEKDTIKQSNQQFVKNTDTNGAQPIKNKAILTLANGTVVVLDDSEEIVEIDDVIINKTGKGQVIYEVSHSLSANNSVKGVDKSYNQISTPRGGQYQLTLPDGTKVWLNAASSLKFPVQFTNKTRSVELIGEAYFEVSAQFSTAGKRIPFIVSTSTQSVEVLGTHFNINSYKDEKAVKTTLLEGKVRVFPNQNKIQLLGKRDVKKKDGIILKPNQQSIFNENDFNIINVDTEEIVAWKNGYFVFTHADITTVMRQLSRWYDVDVEYKGEIPDETFTGKVYRDMDISKVLEILSYAQVNIEINDTKIIVYH